MVVLSLLYGILFELDFVIAFRASVFHTYCMKRKRKCVLQRNFCWTLCELVASFGSYLVLLLGIYCSDFLSY